MQRSVSRRLQTVGLSISVVLLVSSFGKLGRYIFDTTFREYLFVGDSWGGGNLGGAGLAENFRYAILL